LHKNPVSLQDAHDAIRGLQGTKECSISSTFNIEERASAQKQEISSLTVTVNCNGRGIKSKFFGPTATAHHFINTDHDLSEGLVFHQRHPLDGVLYKRETLFITHDGRDSLKSLDYSIKVLSDRPPVPGVASINSALYYVVSGFQENTVPVRGDVLDHLSWPGPPPPRTLKNSFYRLI
jgi:hypothetical protein